MSHGAGAHGAETKEQKVIGLIISIIAIILALVSMVTNKDKGESTVARIEINDTWSFFQAKRLRRALDEHAIDQLSITRSTLPAEKQADIDKLLARYDDEVKKYKEESKEIEEKAKHLEHEYKIISHRIEFYEIAETLLHVAIVVCSITLLTQRPWFFRVGCIAAFGGLAISAYAYFFLH